MSGTAALLLLLAAQPPEGEVLLDRPQPALLTTSRFENELGRSISVLWENVPLRTMLRRLSRDRKISILLDRRIDPGQELRLDISQRSVEEVLRMIAEGCGGRVSVVSNTVYVGPPRSAERLRTLIEIKSDELLDLGLEATKRRQFELARRITVHWNDLERPADIIERIVERYDLQVQGLDSVPHDLWAGATLPGVNSYEVLSLILCQFDLTFEWNAAADGIRIVPVPDVVAIERSYEPRGMTAAAAVARWKDELPEATLAAANGRVVVRGTLEQHEAVEALQRGDHRTASSGGTSKPVPLSRQEFTLRVERVPALAIMRKLEDSGVKFVYDERVLAEAGIDLKTPISMDVRKASAAEFFEAMCRPLDLGFEIEGRAVTLSPKK